jgi:hypothetical protein
MHIPGDGGGRASYHGLTCWFVVEPPAGIEPATHPYHEFRTHRCAELRLCRSPAAVNHQVMCSSLAGRLRCRADTGQGGLQVTFGSS